LPGTTAAKKINSNGFFFPRGIPGLESCRRFSIEAIEGNPIFVLLKAQEEPEAGMFLVDPLVFFPDYSVELMDWDRRELELEKADQMFTFTTVAVEEKRLTTNLAAPIVINVAKKLGKQLVITERIEQMRVPLPLPQREAGGRVENRPAGDLNK